MGHRSCSACEHRRSWRLHGFRREPLNIQAIPYVAIAQSCMVTNLVQHSFVDPFQARPSAGQHPGRDSCKQAGLFFSMYVLAKSVWSRLESLLYTSNAYVASFMWRSLPRIVDTVRRLQRISQQVAYEACLSGARRKEQHFGSLYISYLARCDPQKSILLHR